MYICHGESKYEKSQTHISFQFSIVFMFQTLMVFLEEKNSLKAFLQNLFSFSRRIFFFLSKYFATFSAEYRNKFYFNLILKKIRLKMYHLVNVINDLKI